MIEICQNKINANKVLKNNVNKSRTVTAFRERITIPTFRAAILLIHFLTIFVIRIVEVSIVYCPRGCRQVRRLFTHSIRNSLGPCRATNPINRRYSQNTLQTLSCICVDMGRR